MSSEPSTLPLLLEIGCEEIPARFLTQAQIDLGDRVTATLEEARLLVPEKESIALSHGERVDRGSGTREGAGQDQGRLQTFSTPRRLVASLPAILARQHDKTEDITGPPVKVAVDASGKYTRAAESFAQKNSATIDDLIRVNTPKGEYLAVKKTTPGRPAIEVLSEILPGVITGISFPKSMYWTAESGPRFVRPIRWILAQLGEGEAARVVPFEIAGVNSGNRTFGHRTLGQVPMRVSGFKDYVQKLIHSQVELESEKRRERVRSECKALLEGSGFRVVQDKDLVDWIVNSTEWPRGLKGNFEERFLKLPREILITVMRDHQKYFAVEDEKGSLRPSFVTLLNVDGDAQGIIRRGHERVLTARFSDAEFFWNADQKIPLRDRMPMLDRVTYQAKLGSYADKVRRMEVIAKEICHTLEAQGKLCAPDTAHALRAIQLCKCDLTTQMVQEFTELQGLVGGLYAKAQGEPQEVADAIYDHYLPQGAVDGCPRSVVSAVVSLSDKIDVVVSGFSVGLEPTGSSDPFGLRRAGNGAIRVTAELLPELSLRDLVSNAGAFSPVVEFFRERTEWHLNAAGLRFDTVRAVVQSFLGWTVPADAVARGKALERIRDSEDFVALSSAAKRTRNILAKSARPDDLSAAAAEPINSGLLMPGPEAQLYNAYEQIQPSLVEFSKRREYEDAFRALAQLRPHVDRFFDKVLVMDNNLDVRRNRINLLAKLDEWAFRRFADLSQIESPTSIPVDASTLKAVTSDK